MTVPALVGRVRSQSLADLVQRSACRYPDRLALADGDTRLSYAELDALVDGVAAALAGTGLGPGERLALLSRNSWQFAVLDFAAARAGVVLVPINFMLGANEIAFILDHSGATAFVAQESFLPVATGALDAATSGSVRLRALLPDGGAPTPAASPPAGWVDGSGWFKPGDLAPDIVVGDDDPCIASNVV